MGSQHGTLQLRKDIWKSSRFSLRMGHKMAKKMWLHLAARNEHENKVETLLENELGGYGHGVGRAPQIAYHLLLYLIGLSTSFRFVSYNRNANPQ